MNDKVKIFALGGQSSTGNNLICVEINEDIFVYAAGSGYPDRYTPGVDFVIPNFNYLKEHKEHVKAYFIAHAHDDEVGGLPYIYKDVPAPIYCTPYTALTLNMLSQQRNVDNQYEIVEVLPSDEKQIAGRNVTFFSIVHSSPDSYGISISTSLGNVVFSGDFIVEYTTNPHFKFDIKKLNKIGDTHTLALLVDSENAEKKGYTSPNHRIADLISKPISDSNGRVYIAAYSQHIYNYVEIINECVDAGKYICFFDKESELLFQSLLVTTIISIPYSKIIKISDLAKYSDKDVCIIISGTGELLYTKISSLASREIADTNLYIKESDTFILACPAAANFEVLGIDTLDEIYRTNCDVTEISRKSLEKMHPSEDDIKLLTSIVSPDYFIPIKGEYKDLVACKNIVTHMDLNLNDNNTFVVDNGVVINFEKNKKAYFSTIKDTDVGTLLIDGSGIGDVANEIIDERNQLSNDGVVVLSCLVSKKDRIIVGGPDIQMRGYLYVKDSEPVLKGLTAIFVKIVSEYIAKNGVDNLNDCVKQIKDECFRYTRRNTGSNPVIEPTIVVDD